MKLLYNRVLLLKSEKEDSEDKFENKLLENGLSVSFLKTLEFKFINLNELANKLKNVQEYEGLIFVTPRTVKGIQDALISDRSILNQWNNKSNYVVGKTTHNLVIKELSLQNCMGQESGNASALADIILQAKHTITKCFLYPCGNLKTDILINKLNEHGVKMDVIVIYETISSSTLEHDFETLTNNFTTIPEYWVYFSPSGVKSTLFLVNRLSKDIRSLIKFIAIGPTTNRAMLDNNIPVKAVCRKPTPEDLISAIIN